MPKHAGMLHKIARALGGLGLGYAFGRAHQSMLDRQQLAFFRGLFRRSTAQTAADLKRKAERYDDEPS